MEMSCDEEVISELGANVKADYSMSLVSFASRNHQPKYIVVPVTFSKAVFGRKEVKIALREVMERTVPVSSMIPVNMRYFFSG